MKNFFSQTWVVALLVVLVLGVVCYIAYKKNHSDEPEGNKTPAAVTE